MSLYWHSDPADNLPVKRCDCPCHGVAYELKPGVFALSLALMRPEMVNPIACLEACQRCAALHVAARFDEGLLNFLRIRTNVPRPS